MPTIKAFIKNFLPATLLKFIRPLYHGVLAWDASIYFDRPSEKLITIGITGTAGKSTTTHMLAHILNEAGLQTGYITTVDFFDGKNVFINKHGLSMPNEILLQRQLRVMVAKKCKVAVIECTSEGLAQNRHWGINFDIALITNLSPAHLDSHGGFEPYRAAKAKLFRALTNGKCKQLFPKKIKGLNLDDEGLKYFLQFKTDQTFGVSTNTNQINEVGKVYRGRLTATGLEIEGKLLQMRLPGRFNLQNALMAVACANMMGVNVDVAIKALADFSAVAGRMEEIGNSRGIKIFVDYAPEPAGMQNALQSLGELTHNRIIHVFGSTGGHRDVDKRFEFGKISAKYSGHIIITNDDVYDSDPGKIADDILSGIKQGACSTSYKLQATSWEIVLDRRQAIHHALEIAQKDDIVIITGKGSEQFLVLPGNKRIEWDDREVVREELSKI